MGGFVGRKSTKWTAERREQLRVLLGEGNSRESIAAKMGVTPIAVANAIRRYRLNYLMMHRMSNHRQ